MGPLFLIGSSAVRSMDGITKEQSLRLRLPISYCRVDEISQEGAGE